MSERHAASKLPTGGRQCLAHVAQQKELWRRDAIGMGSHPSLANIDLPLREEFAKMIISPTIAEAEFKHHTF